MTSRRIDQFNLLTGEPEKAIQADPVGAGNCGLAPHLSKEWQELQYDPEPEAKLVPVPLVPCKGIEKGAEVGRELNVWLREVVSTSSLQASIRKNQEALPSAANAKYTDLYPEMTVETVRCLIRDYAQSKPDRWLLEKDLFDYGKESPKRGLQKPTVTLKYQVKAIYRFLVDLVQSFVLYGYCEEYSEMKRRLNHVFYKWLFLLVELGGSAIKLCKYKLGAFAAFAKRSDVFPKSPFSQEFVNKHTYARPDYIFDGKFLRFYLRNVHQFSDFDQSLYHMSFVDTVCRGVKKGSERPTDLEVHKANLSTMECFKKKVDESETDVVYCAPGGEEIIETDDGPTPLWQLLPTRYLRTDNMLNEIRRTVDEVLIPGVAHLNYHPTWHRMPSLSACFENKFSTGGSAFVVKSHLQATGGIGCGAEFVEKRFGILTDPVGRLRPLDGPDVEYPRMYREDVTDGSYNQSTAYVAYSNNYDNLLHCDVEGYFRDLADRYRSGDIPKMSVVGLKEALKIRGITKGEAMETWLLTPLQKHLAKELLKIPCFKVTGTPLKASYLTQMFSELPSDESFLSGDYDNATNEMFSHASLAAITRICENLRLDENVKLVATYSLVSNLVLYKYWDDRTKKVVTLEARQSNAQPMGKVLSFVVLCLVNAAVCRRAKEIDSGRTISLRSFKALINGDDCCFLLKEMKWWEQCAAAVGLFNSVGKTFFSRKFIEMNSRSFIFDWNAPMSAMLPSGDFLNPQFIETPFVNFGLLKGLVRSSGADTSSVRFERFGCLGECHNDLIEGMPALYRELDFLFKYYNADLLKDDALSGIPYYIPKWLGGLGLNPGPNPSTQISFSQRCEASAVFKAKTKPCPAIRGLFDISGSISNLKTCFVHNLVLEKRREVCSRVNCSSSGMEFSKLQLENGEVVDLKEQNLKVYSQMVENAWKQASYEQIKSDFEEDTFENTPQIRRLEIELSRKIVSKTDLQVALNKKHIYRTLRKLSKLWRSVHGLVTDKPELYRPIPWAKLWHEKRTEFLPIVNTSAVLDTVNVF